MRIPKSVPEINLEKLAGELSGWDKKFILVLGSRGFTSQINGIKACLLPKTATLSDRFKTTGNAKGMRYKDLAHETGARLVLVSQQIKRLERGEFHLVYRLNTYNSKRMYDNGNEKISELVLTSRGTEIYPIVRAEFEHLLGIRNAEETTEQDYQI